VKKIRIILCLLLALAVVSSFGATPHRSGAHRPYADSEVPL
jgi:hypothetical protein